MNSEVLVAIGGILLSVLFAYVPGLSQWYENLGAEKGALDPEYPKVLKRLVMAVLLLLAVIVILGLSCAGWMEGLWPDLAVSCDKAGIQRLILAFLLAVGANQGTYWVIPKQNKA